MGLSVVGRIRWFARNPGRVLRRTCRYILSPEERLARLTGPMGYWFELRRYQLEFLKSMGLEPHHTLLDIGCGPLQGGVAFIGHLDPNRYVGVDIRDLALTEAHRQVARYNLAAKNPRLILSHSFGGEELDGSRFDYAWACQVLYHLDGQALERLFGFLYTHLEPGGRLYGDILGRESPIPEETTWNGLRHRKHALESMQAAAARHGLALRRLGPIRDHGYPVPCSLGSNEMLEFTRINDQASGRVGAREPG